MEFPCGGWTPCPSKPKLGNVTTGLQRESMTSLGNLTVPICTWNVVVLTAWSMFGNCAIKEITDLMERNPALGNL